MYGAKIKVKADQKVKTRAVLVEWDPFTNPILTEFTGRVRYQDIVEGITVREEIDEVTGLARKVIIEDAEGSCSPASSSLGVQRRATASDRRTAIRCRSARNLNVLDGAEVFAADILAKIPRETTKTKDITGGLPRVAELFEARKPKEQAVITEIDGRVEMGGFVKGMRKIVIRADNAETKEYLIPQGKHISVQEGDRVRGGRGAHGRAAQPARHLAVLGDRGAAGVPGQRDPGGLPPAGRDASTTSTSRSSCARCCGACGSRRSATPTFLVGELVDRFVFQEENERVLSAGQAPGHGQAAAPRDHQGVAVDRQLHLGGLVPGDHPGADRGGDLRARRTTCAA